MRNFVALVFAVLLVGCVSIEPGSVGVGTNAFDGLEDKVYQPGMNLHSPFTSVHEMSTRMQNFTLGGHRDGEQNDPSVRVLTSDQLPVAIDATIQFSLNGQDAKEIYEAFGEDFTKTVIQIPLHSGIRMAASDFEARALITNRDAFQNKVNELVQQQINHTLHNKQVPNTAILIDSILIRNVDLPDSLEASINRVQQQTMAALERENAIATARQEAERARVEAEGAAAAQQIQARSQAEANRTIAASITPELIRLRAIEAQRAVLSNNQTRTVFVPQGSGSIFNMSPQ